MTDHHWSTPTTTWSPATQQKGAGAHGPRHAAGQELACEGQGEPRFLPRPALTVATSAFLLRARMAPSAPPSPLAGAFSSAKSLPRNKELEEPGGGEPPPGLA